MIRVKTLLVCALVATLLLFSSLLPAGLADGGANHKTRNQHFGVSGGNVNDASKAFCCSGTLGSLITDGSTQYILSNNHVLARSDQAVAGEDVSQPGLIDSSCRVATVVADFTGAAPLGSNVDAAVAQLRPGQMDSSGTIPKAIQEESRLSHILRYCRSIPATGACRVHCNRQRRG